MSLSSLSSIRFKKHPLLGLRPLKPPSSSSSSMSAAISASSNPNSSSTKTVRVVVKGRVQGVFFRDWTVENARELGLNGWVRNRRDGSVEALFSGEPDAVAEMVDRRCRVGPPAAVVTGIDPLPAEGEGPGQAKNLLQSVFFTGGRGRSLIGRRRVGPRGCDDLSNSDVATVSANLVAEPANEIRRELEDES